MGACYKCGRELPGHEVECEPFCPTNPAASRQLNPEDYATLDLRTITNLGDLKAILEILNITFLSVNKRSQVYTALKSFIDPTVQQSQTQEVSVRMRFEHEIWDVVEKYGDRGDLTVAEVLGTLRLVSAVVESDFLSEYKKKDAQ